MDSASSTFDNLLDDLSDLALSYKDTRDSLIIALDFGTTYSGIAYALTTDPEKVFTIDSWPGGDRNAPKTPTALQYGSGSVTNLKWGYELDRLEGEKIQHIKLLLDPEQPRPYFIPTNIEAEMAKLPKPVVDVASDYMRAIFEHAIKEIEGHFLVPELLHNFDKQYVLTVPALWSDKAKDMTSRAAEKAGISPVDMITEPEAAALFTLKDVKNKGLKVNDAVVICDAGGGTVDLISYEILSLAPFELRAITKASVMVAFPGAVAGSSMIDRNLEEEIRKAVGMKRYQNALKEFAIAIKPGFRGKDDRDKYLSFPMAKLEDNPANGLVKNSMTLSGATMFRPFEPIAREVDRLVGEQVSAVKIERLQASPPNPNGVKAIFLVGGFGSSDYLAKAIQNSNPGVTVIQPKEA
ncbi:uncharacterized protein A1O5_07377 [Cladophialophora psammophila CBS 110553]|uniref:Uncharacterized protein n=1 Tax=Cladophialophora psammophila CBS 110553 TaxID=1182543 RepID=W9WXI6_9EURO|nr:uncharacterized protein A1O5_07377 [Cladophialophora psammophila CBS 110553]EXJ69341.1 hypothetical protein A1O5_07377 [Cladophialophora psammophila CBS 110553]